MKYLLMCCFEEGRWAQLPAAERDEIMNKYGKWVHELKQGGQLLAGAKLDDSAKAITVRAKNDKPLTTDGPFAETKEQLGGYHLIECQNQDEAITIARRIPTLPAGGVVEVRPVMFTE